MAIVDDKYILDLEKLRSKLVNILREKGLLVNEDETLANLVPMVDSLIEKNGINSFIEGNITSYKNDEITTIHPYAFAYQRKLEKVKCSSAIDMQDKSFTGCSSLKHVYLPNIVSWTGIEIFNGSLIENLVLPKVTLTNTNTNYLFTNLLKLKRIIVSSIQSFGSNPIFSNNNIVEIIDCFSPCNTSFTISALPLLKTWIIRKDTKIANMANLVNMPNLEEVYVPQALLETYKTATNWSTYTDKIFPLEGSKYESLTWYENEDWYREEMSVWQ